MSFDDLMDRFKKRKKVRVVFNGTVLAVIDTDVPVLKGQAVYLQCEPKPLSALTRNIKPIHAKYEVVRLEYEQDTVVAHVVCVSEEAA